MQKVKVYLFYRDYDTFLFFYVSFSHFLLNERDFVVVFFFVVFLRVFGWLLAFLDLFLFYSESHFVCPIFASSKRVEKGKNNDGEGYISSMVLHCCLEDSHLPVPVVPDEFKVKAGLDKGSGG